MEEADRARGVVGMEALVEPETHGSAIGRRPILTEQCPIGTPKRTRPINASTLVGAVVVLMWAGGCATPAAEPGRSISGEIGSIEAPPKVASSGLAGDLSGGAVMGSPEPMSASPGPGGPAPSEVAANMAAAEETTEPEPGIEPGIEPEVDDMLALARPSEELVDPDGLSTSPAEDSSVSMHIADLDRRLRTLAAEADDPMRFEVVRALLAILAVDELEPTDEIRFSPLAIGLLSEEEESLAAVSGFAERLRGRLVTGEESSRDILLEELQVLLDRLQNDDGLSLGTVDICSSIRGFGDVVAVPRRMATGTDHALLIYAELEGLEWAPTADQGRVGWQVEHRLELHQLADDMVIDPGVPARIGQDLAAPVDDTYFWIQYTLPAADLKAGRYVLKLWIREPATGREVERSIPIDLLPARLIARSPDQR